MATFLDKKEQVIDFKLTSYGRYSLSIGSFSPTYYAFFDDNVLYDTRYMGGGPGDRPFDQNLVTKRIKEDTPYLEGFVLFRDVDKNVSENTGEIINYLDIHNTPTQITPDADVYKFTAVIGDAFLDGETADAVPAWQVLMMQGNISSSVYRQGGPPVPTSMPGVLLRSFVPQINIQAIYQLKVTDPEFDFDAESVRSLSEQSQTFVDNKVISVEMEDPLVYFNEINTQLLTENFDIEVFEVISGSLAGLYSPTLQRKYFEKAKPQIENGIMLTETPTKNPIQNLTTSSVEYYFDVLTDSSVNQQVACQGVDTFNKQSYYISFDFDCAAQETDAVFYDIYGNVTEPEICQT